MTLIFGLLVISAFIILLTKRKDSDEDAMEFDFKPLPSALIGASVGVVAGIVGAGGGFILIPLMIRILKVPVKITVGSSLGIVFIGAFMGAVGKVSGNQIPWEYVGPAVVGAIPASIIGAFVSKKLPAKVIRYALLTLIF